jgi:hypothetical protein
MKPGSAAASGIAAGTASQKPSAAAAWLKPSGRSCCCHHYCSLRRLKLLADCPVLLPMHLLTGLSLAAVPAETEDPCSAMSLTLVCYVTCSNQRIRSAAVLLFD